jgi:hypothetical protein
MGTLSHQRMIWRWWNIWKLILDLFLPDPTISFHLFF